MTVNIKHGHASGGKTSPTYQSWRAMWQRCVCVNNKDYHSYGGKGIKVTPEWQNFICFLTDMGERPSKDYSLDRINPCEDYSPANCQWLLKSENSSKANKQKYSERGPVWFDRICLYCGVKFRVRRSEILRGSGKYCSISCGVTARNLARGRKGGAKC